MAKGTCIFCKRIGPLTGEHMLPDWMNRYIPKVGEATHQYLDGESQPVRPSWRGPAFETRVPVVCASCNNGWMSALEDPLMIAPLIMGSKRIELTPEQQERLSAWLFLRAIMIQEHGADRAIPEAHYARLYETKHAPEMSIIYLFAFLTGDQEMKDIVSYRCLRSAEVQTGYALVMTIGNLGALIFGHSEEGDYAVGIPDSFEAALIRMAAAQPSLVAWPPTLALDAVGREVLGDSFILGRQESFPAGARPA